MGLGVALPLRLADGGGGGGGGMGGGCLGVWGAVHRALWRRAVRTSALIRGSRGAEHKAMRSLLPC